MLSAELWVCTLLVIFTAFLLQYTEMLQESMWIDEQASQLMPEDDDDTLGVRVVQQFISLGMGKAVFHQFDYMKNFLLTMNDDVLNAFRKFNSQRYITGSRKHHL